MVKVESQEQKGRGALYVDGFNLYHPIKELGPQENYLKWACLWRLGELLCAQYGLELVKTVLCTAVPQHLPEQRDRHNVFNAAQIARGVFVRKGHHVPDGNGYSEKQSDINVALSVICDGEDDLYDTAFLLSADSDQVATAHFFKDRLRPKGKQLIAAIPFGRPAPSGYSALGFSSTEVTKAMIERCCMPETVTGKTGYPVRRPDPYAPPEGWVHPDDRKKGPPPKAPKKWGPAFKAPK